MEFEHDIKVLSIDNNLQSEVEKLHMAGWQIFPGVMPVAIYHLVRIKTPVQEDAGQGKMLIDDSQVFVIPAKDKQN